MLGKRIFIEESSGVERLRKASPPKRIFLLSPVNVSGVRAKMLFNPSTQFDLAQRLRKGGAPLGEVFSFVSGLYFRGKLAYAECFANPSGDVAGVHIITAGAGLMAPGLHITLAELQRISDTDIDPKNHKYRQPLDRDTCRLRGLLHSKTEVVLLGSIATSKYIDPLLEVFGERLVFPKEFIGRGDMSRGGLLLRSCAQGLPLEYAAVRDSIPHGQRPPKLSAKHTTPRQRRG